MGRRVPDNSAACAFNLPEARLSLLKFNSVERVPILRLTVKQGQRRLISYVAENQKIRRTEGNAFVTEIYLSLSPIRKCNSGGSPNQERGKFRAAHFSQTIEAEFRKFTNMVFARQAARRIYEAANKYV